MKTLFKLALALVLTLTTFTATANSGLEKKSTELNLKAVEKGSIIVLKDKFDTVLYHEIVEETGNYKKKFDFTLLPKGYYFFEVANGNETKRYPVKITEDTAKINTKRETKIYAPTVTLRKNLLYVSQSSTRNVALKISVFSKNNDGTFTLVKKDFVKDDNFAGRIYKLNKKKAKNYKVVITTSNGDKFEEFVKL
jgi:hypothetical protein